METPEDAKKIDHLTEALIAAHQKGDTAACRACADELIAFVESLDEPSFEYRKLRAMWGSDNKQDYTRDMVTIYQEAVVYYHQRGDVLKLAECLSHLASTTYFDLNDYHSAMRFLNKAQALVNAISPEKIKKMARDKSDPYEIFVVERNIRWLQSGLQHTRRQIIEAVQKHLDSITMV